MSARPEPARKPATGPGPAQGRRAADVALALMLAGLLWPLILGVAAWIRLRDGPPVFYRAERMATPDQAFALLKFRTMRPAAQDAGVSGGDKRDRITRSGAVLRATRLDELPQLWNILRGDVGFVGPRPPLRRYVDMAPALYARVLRQRPGVTGLASVVFHRHEERLLAACTTPQETEAVYLRRCVPRKARLDLIHQARRTVALDLWILLATLTGRRRWSRKLRRLLRARGA